MWKYSILLFIVVSCNYAFVIEENELKPTDDENYDVFGNEENAVAKRSADAITTTNTQGDLHNKVDIIKNALLKCCAECGSRSSSESYGGSCHKYKYKHHTCKDKSISGGYKHKCKHPCGRSSSSCSCRDSSSSGTCPYCKQHCKCKNKSCSSKNSCSSDSSDSSSYSSDSSSSDSSSCSSDSSSSGSNRKYVIRHRGSSSSSSSSPSSSSSSCSSSSSDDDDSNSSSCSCSRGRRRIPVYRLRLKKKYLCRRRACKKVT